MKKQNTFKYLQIIAIFASALLLAQFSHAFLTVNETAEILPDNYFKVGFVPQLVVSDGGGLNVGAFADMHLADDIDGRITAGGGKTDFWTQASAKWVPFPDVDRQPALGARGAVIYSRHDDKNFIGFQVTPMMSKRADTRYGNMIPYVALPLTYFNTKNDNFVASQFTVGSEWFPQKDRHLGVEFNMNLSKSVSSIAFYIGFPFEGTTGFKKYQ